MTAGDRFRKPSTFRARRAATARDASTATSGTTAAWTWLRAPTARSTRPGPNTTGPSGSAAPCDGGRSFSPAQRIAGRGRHPARAPSLALGPDRTVYLAWTTRRGRWRPTSTSPSPPTAAPASAGRSRVAPSKNYSDAPKLAVGPGGVLHLAYAESSGGPFARYQVRYTRSTDGGRSFESAARDFQRPAGAVRQRGISGIWASMHEAGSTCCGSSTTTSGNARAAWGWPYPATGATASRAPAWCPDSADPGGGFNGSTQGLLMRKLAVSADGAVAIVNSSLKQDAHSRVWLMRGARLSAATGSMWRERGRIRSGDAAPGHGLLVQAAHLGHVLLQALDAVRPGRVGRQEAQAAARRPRPGPSSPTAMTEASGSKPARAASSSPTRSASISSSRLNLQREQLRADAAPPRRRAGPGPAAARRSTAAAPVPWLLAMRARACSRSACAISWPITIATSSSVSLQLVEDAGEEGDLAARHAEGVDLLAADQVDFPASTARRARSTAARSGMRRAAIARSRCSCGWLSGASAPLACACSISCAVLLRAGLLQLLGRHQVARREASPTSTCASAGVAARRAGGQQEGAARHPGGRLGSSRCWHMGAIIMTQPPSLMSDTDHHRCLRPTPPPPWARDAQVYLEPATLRMLFLGFSAGLPLLLVLGTLSFRLREAGIDRTTIGYLSLGRPGLRLQVGLGAAGGPAAASRC